MVTDFKGGLWKPVFGMLVDIHQIAIQGNGIQGIGNGELSA
jgi:hypothetical protein